MFDRRWYSLCVALLAVSCSSVSDTGFVGTWSRPMGPVESIVSIDRDEDGYTFCWSRPAAQTAAGRHECTGDNRTEVYMGTEAVYAYDFKVRPGESQNELLVEVEGQALDGRSTPIHFLDRLELQPGGLVLESQQLELNHVSKDPPGAKVRFAKVSDRPL